MFVSLWRDAMVTAAERRWGSPTMVVDLAPAGLGEIPDVYPSVPDSRHHAQLAQPPSCPAHLPLISTEQLGDVRVPESSAAVDFDEKAGRQGSGLKSGAEGSESAQFIELASGTAEASKRCQNATPMVRLRSGTLDEFLLEPRKTDGRPRSQRLGDGVRRALNCLR
jgi:hypothetical protein